MPVTATKEEAIETVETTRAGENSKKRKNGEYLQNLIQVPYI